MQNIKKYVKEQYSKIVSQGTDNSSCCNTACCKEGFNEDYTNVKGYNPDADYGLGCGLPTKFAKLQLGQTVLDLGSGAGNDCFIARAEVGENGQVYGLDFSEDMVKKARKNAYALGYSNVDFIVGDIEEMPIENGSVDVVVSNCVLNLVPDKEKVFSNIYKVLKTNGYFSISDVVTSSELSVEMSLDLDLLSSCVSGAIPKEAYIEAIKKAGFKHITIQKERELSIPNNIDRKYKIPADFKIWSLTIYAEK